MKKNKNYTPTPQVPPEMLERLALIQEVLAGKTTVSEAARRLGMSRNHFQTILERGLAGLVKAIGPKPGGRPAKAKELKDLEAEVARLRLENAELSQRVGTTDRFLEVASGLLHGRIRTSGRQAGAKKAKASPDEKKPDEPDGDRQRALQGVEQMRRGLMCSITLSCSTIRGAGIRRSDR